MPDLCNLNKQAIISRFVEQYKTDINIIYYLYYICTGEKILKKVKILLDNYLDLRYNKILNYNGHTNRNRKIFARFYADFSKK